MQRDYSSNPGVCDVKSGVRLDLRHFDAKAIAVIDLYAA